MRVSKKFGERTPTQRSGDKAVKYYLVFEGKKTEPIYFEAVEKYREELGIHPLTELIPLERSYSEEGWSNPEKLSKLIEKYLDESENGVYTYRHLIDWVLDTIRTRENIQGYDTWIAGMDATLSQVCKQKMGKKLTDSFSVVEIHSVCGEFAGHLSQLENGLNETVSLIPQVIQQVFSAYDEKVDKICLIVDRDRDSFVTRQYNKVLKTCQEKNIGFYPSNPNFEFWLLMHYDDVYTLDREMLWANPYPIPRKEGDCCYTETELRKRMPDYQKKKYDVDTFMKRIDTAIKNETAFCEDEELLKDKIGSRVGILIQTLRGKQGP